LGGNLLGPTRFPRGWFLKSGQAGQGAPVGRRRATAGLSNAVSGTDFAIVALSLDAQLPNEKLMNHLRYVVVRREAEWTIVQGGRRYSGSYPSKRQAVCAAIEFGEKDGHAGRRVEVLVGHEDGHFLTE
jgi:hypothetical protein